jgi:preprotein translocase subunit SecG
MSALMIAILIIHVLLSLLLIVVVLIQQRTKGGIASVFGGGGGTGAEQLFGSSGVAPFLTRITTILGTAYIVTSLVLLLISIPQGTVTRRASGGAEPVQDTVATDTTSVQPEGDGTESPQGILQLQPLLPETTTTGGN